MDRSKWEYKKLGEVCTVVSGSTPKTQVEEFWNGDHYWITPAELDGSTYVSKSDRLITDAAIKKTNLTLLPIGTVLLSSRAPIGKVAITTVPMYCNQGFKNLICSDAMYNKYLYWFLKVNTEYLNSLGRGATFKEISKTIVENIKVPIYSFKDQQRIVAELDCLNEMIALKHEQLKEFDKLAQSIFYDMFGDPVANEKGWDINRLEENVTLINGRAYKQDELLSDGKYKVIRVGNFFSNSTYYYSDLELENDKYCEAGDLLYTWSASFGARIWEGEKVIYHYHIWKVNYDVKRYNKLFLCYLLNVLTEKFKENVHGVTMVHLTKAGMEKTEIPLPPLALQQQFAEKIQAIEAQKELVKQSIAETQQLLDSRMDYYFD